eukprot:14583143-Alexandrium_andersonii.AAC.1
MWARKQDSPRANNLDPECQRGPGGPAPKRFLGHRVTVAHRPNGTDEEYIGQGDRSMDDGKPLFPNGISWVGQSHFETTRSNSVSGSRYSRSPRHSRKAATSARSSALQQECEQLTDMLAENAASALMLREEDTARRAREDALRSEAGAERETQCKPQRNVGSWESCRGGESPRGSAKATPSGRDRGEGQER